MTETQTLKELEGTVIGLLLVSTGSMLTRVPLNRVEASGIWIEYSLDVPAPIVIFLPYSQISLIVKASDIPPAMKSLKLMKKKAAKS